MSSLEVLGTAERRRLTGIKQRDAVIAFQDFANAAVIGETGFMNFHIGFVLFGITFAFYLDFLTHLILCLTHPPEVLEMILTALFFVFGTGYIYWNVLCWDDVRFHKDDILYLLLGRVDLQWSRRREHLKKLARLMIRQELDEDADRKAEERRIAELNPAVPYIENWAQSIPREIVRLALIKYYRDEMIHAIIHFMTSFYVGIPLVIVKIFYEFQEINSGNCTIKIFARIPLICLCLFNFAYCSALYDVACHNFLKIQTWKYFIYTTYKSQLFTKSFNRVAMTSMYCYHFAFSLSRIILISAYFLTSTALGLAHLAFLILTSGIFHLMAPQHYENPPLSVPTKSSDMDEILGKVITIKTLFIVKAIRGRFPILVGIGQRLPIFLLIIGQYIGGICLQIIFLEFHGEIHTDSHTSNLTTPCFLGSGVSTVVQVLSENFDHVFYDRNQEIPFVSLLHNFQTYMCLLLIVVTIWHLLTIQYYGLICDEEKFPVCLAIHIWVKRFMDNSDKHVELDIEVADIYHWLKKCYAMTILSESDFYEYVDSKPIDQINWTRIYQRILTANPNVCQDQLDASIQTDNPMKVRFDRLVEYGNASHNPDIQKLTWLFCLKFDGRMENLTSRRIGKICEILKENPDPNINK